MAGDHVETARRELRVCCGGSFPQPHREALEDCLDDHRAFARYTGAWVDVCTGVGVGMLVYADADYADKAINSDMRSVSG